VSDRQTTASVAVVRSVAIQFPPMLGASSSAAGKASTSTMDPWAAAKWYIVTKALGSVPGMKVMLLDNATSATVGLVCSQSQALEFQVYHADKLENPRTKKLDGFRAVVIVRPSSENIRAIRQELSDPKFDEYHLFFTNTLQDHHLQDIARSDLSQVVRQVQELYVDYFPLGQDLFTIDEPSCMALEPPSWDQPLFDRLCDGITAVLLALKLNPVIVYQINSPAANKIAHQVTERIATGNHSSDPDLFRFGAAAAAKQQPPLLLLLDRRDDPVTPLLSQWSYSAMVHEMLGLRHNRVTVKKGQEEEHLVLNPVEDDFYQSAQHLVFGELGSALKTIVDEFQKSESGTVASGGGKSRLSSIADIQRFMENYPDFKKQQGMVAKHVALTSELSAVVDARNLLDLSELEQELACEESLTDSFDRVETFLADPKVLQDDKLRLVALYSLRYQMEGERETRFLERSLQDSGLDKEKIKAIALLRKISGVAVRGSDIFNKRTVMGAAKGIVRRQMEGVKGVSNVLTRYEPLLASRLAALKMGGIGALRESEFKVLGGSASNRASARPQQIVVFIVGGATYAEARCIAEFNRDNATRGMRAVLGCNVMHTTASYLEDILRSSPQELETS